MAHQGRSTPGLLRGSEVARRIGALPSTVKYYRSLGLVTPVAATQGGYHLYDDEAVLRVQEIRRLQSAGLRLDEIVVHLPATPAMEAR